MTKVNFSDFLSGVHQLSVLISVVLPFSAGPLLTTALSRSQADNVLILMIELKYYLTFQIELDAGALQNNPQKVGSRRTLFHHK